MKRFGYPALGIALFSLTSACGENDMTSEEQDVNAITAQATCGDPGCLDATFDENGQVVRQLGYQVGGYKDVAVTPRGTIVAVGDYQPFNVTGMITSFFTSSGAPSRLGESNGETTFLSLKGFFGNGVAVNADSQIALAGKSTAYEKWWGCHVKSSDCSDRFLVARLDENGKPDTSFAGGDGIRTFSHSSFAWNEAKAVAFQSTNHVVAVGFVAGSGQVRGAIARLDRYGNGALSGATSGYRVLQLPTGWSNEIITDVAIQKDNKIITVGLVFDDDQRSGGTFVRRFLPDGTIDDAFGEHLISDGRISGGSGKTYLAGVSASSIALDSLDRIYVGGAHLSLGAFVRPFYYDTLERPAKFVVKRLTKEGRQDNTWGDRGNALLDSSYGTFDTISSLAVANDGKVVFTGTTYDWPIGTAYPYARDLIVGRFLATGLPDYAFSHGDAMSRVLVSTSAGLALQPWDGRIVVSGQHCGSDRYCDGVVFRYLD